MSTRLICKKALELHSARLSVIDGVVGCGIVPLTPGSKELGLAVYVRDRGVERAIPARVPAGGGNVVSTVVIVQGAVTREALA